MNHGASGLVERVSIREGVAKEVIFELEKRRKEARGY